MIQIHHLLIPWADCPIYHAYLCTERHYQIMNSHFFKEKKVLMKFRGNQMKLGC